MDAKVHDNKTPDPKSPLPDHLLRRRTRLRGPAAAGPPSSEPDHFFGQDRARAAVDLAAAMPAKGFNLFVAAPSGAEAPAAVRTLLERTAAQRTTPDDWVYVYNFETPHRPRALRLPPGKAVKFRDAVRELIVDLIAALPAAFEKQDFQARRQALEDSFKERREDAFEALGEEGHKRDVAIIQTPVGFSLAPVKDGEVMDPKTFNELPEEEQKRRQAQLREVQGLLEETIRLLPKWERERRDGIRKLERETAEAAITQSIEETKKALQDLPAAISHLEAMRVDLLENVVFFANVAAQSSASGNIPSGRNGPLGPFDRYDVNVLVTHAGSQDGAPVVEEAHPTLANLVGRVEHRAEAGVLTTSFMLIKAGALHAANGGFLILDARSLLREPMAWEALKRSLRQSRVKIESLGEALSLSTTITLDPEPIPIDLRVILVGDTWIYHVLAAYDPEFEIHFKLLADFETDVARTDASELAYADTLRALAAKEGLLPPETGALERLIDEAARSAGDAEKLTLVSSNIRDLMIEASHRAGAAGRASITTADVEAAVSARRHRLSRISDRMQETILRDIALIDTDGTATGQVNGLSVFQIGGFQFGKPTRITARTRPGGGRLVDIEREARLGGPIHSKGVMILSGYVAGRYALEAPLSLHASLVFEQSYGGVEGDSASLAELCALLSDLAGVPLRQELGVTGAVSQQGEVQAIGGVNEKIEGFFDICAARGLTGRQGAVIPASNVQHLMLKDEVVEASRAGRFAVYPVRTVDEAIELLTGEPATAVHEKVEARLQAYARALSSAGGKVETTMAERTPESAPPTQPPGTPPEEPPGEPPRMPPGRSATGRDGHA